MVASTTIQTMDDLFSMFDIHTGITCGKNISVLLVEVGVPKEVLPSNLARAYA